MDRQTPSAPMAMVVAFGGFFVMALLGGLMTGLAAAWLYVQTGAVDEERLILLASLGLPLQGAAMIAGIVWLAARTTDGWREALAWKPARRWWMVPLVLPVGLVSDSVVQWASELLPGLDWGGLGALNDALLETGPVGFVLVAAGAVITAPLAEELLFRGYAFKGLKRGWGTLVAILVSSVIFALYHGDPLHVLGVVVIGLYLGWLRHLTGSIWTCVAAHALNNATWVGFTVTVGLVPEIPLWLTLCCAALTFVPMAIVSRR